MHDLQVLVVDDYHREEVKNSTDDILLTRKDETHKFLIKYSEEANQLLIVFLTKNKQKNLKSYLMNYVLVIFHYRTMNEIKNIFNKSTT